VSTPDRPGSSHMEGLILAQVTRKNTPLSSLFIDSRSPTRFRRAEDSCPPALPVEIEPRAPLAPGAVVRSLVEA
jgi:hypothetical protein